MDKQKEETKTEEKQKKKWSRDNKITDFKEDDLQMGDVFDVTKEVLIVHSPITSMNPDFILSDLDPALLENPLVTYTREQLKVIEAINIHLDNKELQDEEWRIKVNQILLNEVYSLMIISRPKDGRVIKAILEYIKGNTQQAPSIETQEKEPEPKGLSKLNPTNWFKKRPIAEAK